MGQDINGCCIRCSASLLEKLKAQGDVLHLHKNDYNNHNHNKKINKNIEKLKPIYIPDGKVKWYSNFENRLRINLLYNPGILF